MDTMQTWRKAKAADMRVGNTVRISYTDGPFSFIGKVDRHWRGWNTRLVGTDGAIFVISPLFSDWGLYTIWVKP